MLAQSGSLMDVGRKAFTEQVSRPESEKELTSSKLQTVDASDQMVRFAKGEVQDYWPEPMSFSRRTDVAEVLELQLARANELFEEERRGGNVAAAVAN